MGVITGNPKERFPNPINAEVFAALEAQASSRTFILDYADWDIDDYQLHTHPDLGERLSELAGRLPEQCLSAAYGCPILVTGDGVIFALTRGTSELAFRLPTDVRPLALELSALQYVGYGDDWFSFNPWHSTITTRQMMSELEFWCERAYAYAKTLGGVN